MKKRAVPGLLLVWCLAAWCSLAHSQVTAVIEGPQQAEIGDLVVLDGLKSNGTAFRWLLVNSKKSFLPVENGRRLVFSSGQPGEYIFVLVVGGHDAADQLAVGVAEHHLVLGTIPPAPNPPGPAPPGPIPPPDPTPAPTAFQDHILEQLKAGGVTRAESAAVAANYDAVRAGIENAGKPVVPEDVLVIGTPAAAFQTLSRMNQQTLGPRWPAWQPIFRAIDQRATREMKANTVFEVGRLLAETSQALRRF